MNIHVYIYIHIYIYIHTYVCIVFHDNTVVKKFSEILTQSHFESMSRSSHGFTRQPFFCQFLFCSLYLSTLAISQMVTVVPYNICIYIYIPPISQI